MGNRPKDTRPTTPPACVNGCGHFTDGTREVCCSACPTGQHLAGCWMRRALHGKIPPPRSARGVVLQVRVLAAAVVLLLVAAGCAGPEMSTMVDKQGAAVDSVAPSPARLDTTRVQLDTAATVHVPLQWLPARLYDPNGRAVDVDTATVNGIRYVTARLRVGGAL